MDKDTKAGLHRFLEELGPISFVMVILTLLLMSTLTILTQGVIVFLVGLLLLVTLLAVSAGLLSLFGILLDMLDD